MMIMAYDPRKYTLKTNAATPAKINRLIKAVKDNAIKDRKKSEELLAKVSNTFEQIHSNFDSEDNEGVKIYTEIAKTVIQAINSNGAANKLVMASATAMRPEAGASSDASGVRSPMLMASPAKLW